ncbi:hypothetical protein PV382_18160 [Streptomyces scabiei]|uniref:hypothetical protein n=1 Tax=Streptomyces scabiei TaxID=1930 RepID=UPI0029AD5891|nr:hypothetical protein [Streptomyces scabiei]MDX2658253.1 hypothetical protein [Streptomyces scabiei]MDX2870538.1 hypothetical protein [Streptomyces scabiei]MDX2999484.1 hypothetical protein [Streptomyces scabiei]MDX3053044.1 hypothetical protein [Streptomyces scabiei]MDX3174202.1 hypothetical protein [Streptomyces scabiei]
MDIEALMTQQGMRTFTDEQRDTWVNDAVQVRQLTQIIQARLANTEIDGDRTGSAGRRARKVARQLGKVAKLLEKAAAQVEGANATYVREVLELPERRVRELERKEQRRNRLGIAASSAQDTVAKSLTKTTNTLSGVQPQPGNTQVTAAPPVPQYVSAQPYQFPGQATGPTTPIPDIGDFFGKEAL